MEKTNALFKGICNTIRFKKIPALLILSFAFNLSFAGENGKPLSLGTVAEFKNSFSKIDPSGRKFYPLKLESDREISIRITSNDCKQNDCHIFGYVVGQEQATFFSDGDEKNFSGKVIFQKTKEAYDIYTSDKGEVLIAPIDIHEVICIDYQKYNGGEEFQNAEQNAEQNAVGTEKNTQTTVIPLLNSLPGAFGTIYLDFDGENVTGTHWPNINALPSSFSDTEITTIWTSVSEDYSPFNVNITTDLSVFNAAPTLRRLRVIFTPTDDASPGAGGVAFLGSFGNSNDPCWIFNPTVKSAMEAASHESGHTMGLTHDGRTTPLEEYYKGQSPYGPIMGACYYIPTVQWSKGEYAAASNTQNDLTVISSKIPYRTDNAGNDPANAKPLVITSGIVSPSSNFGVIEKTTDKDVFGFTTTGGAITLSIAPKTQSGSSSIPDLDIQARLLDYLGAEIAKVDASSASGITTTVTINKTLTAGTYYLEIDGVGYGNPLTNGYSDYGSLGQYFISGNVPGGAGATGMNDLSNVHAISIFPNPSAGLFTINAVLEGNNEIILEIINSLGQPVIVSTENTSGNIHKEIDLSGQAAGIYCIVLKSGKDIWQGKVILK